MECNLSNVEEVVDRVIRPKLQEHHGDLDVLSVKEGVVRVAFKGACKGCPSAQMTIEDVVTLALQTSIDGIQDVVLVQQVNPDMMAFARQILNKS